MTQLSKHTACPYCNTILWLAGHLKEQNNLEIVESSVDWNRCQRGWKWWRHVRDAVHQAYSFLDIQPSSNTYCVHTSSFFASLLCLLFLFSIFYFYFFYFNYYNHIIAIYLHNSNVPIAICSMSVESPLMDYEQSNNLKNLPTNAFFPSSFFFIFCVWLQLFLYIFIYIN